MKKELSKCCDKCGRYAYSKTLPKLFIACKNPKCPCHQETKEMKEEYYHCEKHRGLKGFIDCEDCKLTIAPSISNKNIECWEKEFWKKFGGGDKIALNLNGDIYLMGKVQDAIDFIRNLLSAQREQICKEIEGLEFREIEAHKYLQDYKIRSSQFKKDKEFFINLINSSK